MSFENIIYFDTKASKCNIKFKHVLRENVFVISVVEEKVLWECDYTSCLLKQY